MKTLNRYQKGKSARKRWSLNAVLAKERKRIERDDSPLEELPPFKAQKLPRLSADLRVSITRRDGGTVNFTLRYFYGKLIGKYVNMTPKQFGRKLGEVFEVWMKD